MAKSRRKSGGCTRGRYKLKKMGKGWTTMRRQRGHAKPIERGESPPQPAAASQSP